MKRLFKNLESTFPFVNNDFVDTLQNQHIIAYSAYLDGMNDQKYSTFSTNRGIVLRGIEVEATPVLGQSNFEKFDWQFTIDTNSLVYFDGQYYTPNETFANQTFNYTSYSYVYIYPTYATVSRLFRIGNTQSMITTYTFGLQETNTNLDFPGITQGVPFIEYSRGGTSRNFSRLLRLNSTAKGDVLTLSETKTWSVDWNNIYNYSKYGYFRDFLPIFFSGDLPGRNELQGFNLMVYLSGTDFRNNMTGRFPVAYDYASNTTPNDSTDPSTSNYGLINNKGGAANVILTTNQLGAHNHGGKSEITTQNLDHSHGIYSGLRVEWDAANNKPFEFEQTPKAIPAALPGTPTELYFSRGYPIFAQAMYPSGGLGDNPVVSPINWSSTTDPGTPKSNNHKHQINSAGGGNAHENRPPYMVVLYIYKR